MKKTYLLAATSIFCWSTVATITKLMLGTLNNVQLLWISSLFASAFLCLVNVVNGSIKKLKGYTAKDYIISSLICIPGTLFYYLFYYAGAERMLASQAFIVNYMWPIMCVVFACIILKEKLTTRKIVAILVSFLGVGVATGTDLLSLNHNTIVGSVFCLLGAVSYGAFTALNQKVKYDKGVSMMIGYFASFLITTLINAVNGDLFLPVVGQMPGIIWNAVFTMAIANTVWVIALGNGNTAKISNLAYITPFLSLVWTALILKEPITINSVLGLVIIVVGIFIQLKDKSQQENLPTEVEQ